MDPNTEDFAKNGGAVLLDQIGSLTTLVREAKKETDESYRSLKELASSASVSAADGVAKMAEFATDYAEKSANIQRLDEELKAVKRSLESPIFQSKADLKDHDTRMAIDLQRRIHVSRGGATDDFVPDMANLVDVAAYRSAANKIANKVGIFNKDEIFRNLTEIEQRTFNASNMGAGMYSPELLGIEIDCNIECASLLDLYSQVNVTKSSFMYPKVEDYGAIGSYTCPAACDAEIGPEGNIKFLQGKTYDFRGLFCFQKRTLEEANYDLLGFMIRAMMRSYRINRNRAMISGDGQNEPLGWLTANKFQHYKTAETGKFTAQDFRYFLGVLPREYGPIVGVMHQNVLAALLTLVDANGRVLLGDNDMFFGPDNVGSNLRFSNCLPDATGGNPLKTLDDLTPGDFLMAAANWETAYYSVTKKPIFLEYWAGQSSAWCSKWQFGAEDGGFLGCEAAGAILTVA